MSHVWGPDPEFREYLRCGQCGTRVGRHFVALIGDRACRGEPDKVSLPFSEPAAAPPRARLWPRRIAALATDCRNAARFALEAHEQLLVRAVRP